MFTVDRIQGIWGSYYNMPEAIFYLLKGNICMQDLYTLFGDALGKLSHGEVKAQAFSAKQNHL